MVYKDIAMTAISDSLRGWFRRKVEKIESPPEAETAKPSVSSTTGGGTEHEPVVVWEAANRMEAEIVKGRLESEGIPAIIRGEALGTIYGLTTGALAVTTVLVPAPLAEKALDILSAEVEWDETDDADSPE